MKNFIVSLLMCLMIWTVVDRFYNSDSWVMYYVLEHENTIRKVIGDHNYLKNCIIVGDEVEIITDRWSTKTLRRIK